MTEEQVALVDDGGRVVGSAPRSVMRRDNLPHVVVAVLVTDPTGRVYVHRRTEAKDVFPGLHDSWVAGCLLAGEEPEAAALRELSEELGINGVSSARCARSGTPTTRPVTSATRTPRRTTGRSPTSRRRWRGATG